LLEDLEILALGELNLTPEEFGAYTIGELEAMLDGWQRRRYQLEDLFIIYSALPTYQGAYGRKAPSYRKLTRHRRSTRRVAEIDEEDLKEWREILKGAERIV
jgi:hypothetical protein